MNNAITNVVFAGLGGQGVLKASDILAEVAFKHGLDVKKSEIHGMSQRGGSVSSDVRFGREVLSPMVPGGAADFVIVFAPEEVENSRRYLRPGGMLISPEVVPADKLPHPRSLNVALLGALSTHLPFSAEEWQTTIKASLDAKLHEVNLQAFELGRQCAKAIPAG